MQHSVELGGGKLILNFHDTSGRLETIQAVGTPNVQLTIQGVTPPFSRAFTMPDEIYTDVPDVTLSYSETRESWIFPVGVKILAVGL